MTRNSKWAAWQSLEKPKSTTKEVVIVEETTKVEVITESTKSEVATEPTKLELDESVPVVDQTTSDLLTNAKKLKKTSIKTEE